MSVNVRAVVPVIFVCVVFAEMDNFLEQLYLAAILDAILILLKY